MVAGGAGSGSGGGGPPRPLLPEEGEEKVSSQEALVPLLPAEGSVDAAEAWALPKAVRGASRSKHQSAVIAAGSHHAVPESITWADAAAGELAEAVLKRAAAEADMSVEDLKALPQGKPRRNLHDDLTIIVVDLTQSSSQFSPAAAVQ